MIPDPVPLSVCPCSVIWTMLGCTFLAIAVNDSAGPAFLSLTTVLVAVGVVAAGLPLESWVAMVAPTPPPTRPPSTAAMASAARPRRGVGFGAAAGAPGGGRVGGPITVVGG